MRGHQYTIDRWDDATGENLVEEIAWGAGFVAVRQTFGFGGQTVVLGGQTRGCVHEPAWGRFQRNLSARQPGYTLWTMIQWAIMAS